MVHIAPVTTRRLSIIPNTPTMEFRHHIAPYFWGFLIIVHMKHGYANVTGSAIPPINPAKLGKNGNATAIKNAKHPNNTLSPERSHLGQGLFILLVYLISKLSKTGIAYIWNELRQLSTTSKLVVPSSELGVPCSWYLYKAVKIPPFPGICH